MTQALAQAVAEGDFVWSELGAWTLKAHPERLANVDVDDAFTVGYLDITEQGKRNLDIRLAELEKVVELRKRVAWRDEAQLAESWRRK